MITSGQIKAARGLLNWTVQKLADQSGLGFTTIVRMESANGVPPSQAKTVNAVRQAIEKAGVEFIGSPDQGAGVRWKINGQ